MKKNYYIICCAFISVLFLNSCKTTGKFEKKESAHYTFEKVKWNSVELKEDSSKIDNLKLAIESNLKWLNRKKEDSVFKYNDISFTTKDFICTINSFLIDISDKNRVSESILEKYFDIYKIEIKNEKPVLFTGYYIPYAEASEIKTSKYKVPVYKTPSDLITVNLEEFNPDYKGKVIRGRVHKNKLVPYWTRQEISEGNKLKNKDLEIAWVKNKTDLFFIEIQGSALLSYADGSKKYIHYASQNGREYKPIGALLLNEGILKKSDVSMQAIRAWLNQNPKEVQRVLNYNKSFVFFNLENEGPFGNINVKLVGGRSIAADQRVLPAGTLTLLDFPMPNLPNEPLNNLSKNTAFSQLAFVQDTGGAIKGPGRVDVFWGEGDDAGEIAGVTKQSGSLYILVPKMKCGESLLVSNK